VIKLTLIPIKGLDKVTGGGEGLDENQLNFFEITWPISQT
jgi:hypothetical protein